MILLALPVLELHLVARVIEHDEFNSELSNGKKEKLRILQRLGCKIGIVDSVFIALLEKLARDDLLGKLSNYDFVVVALEVEYVRQVRVKQPKFTLIEVHEVPLTLFL